QGIQSIRAEAMKIELFRLGIETLSEFVCKRVLPVDLVEQSPGDEAKVIAVGCDHIVRLLEAVLNDLQQREGRIFESVITRHHTRALQQDAVAVTIIENTTILLPGHTDEDTVQVFQVIMIVNDPFG